MQNRNSESLLSEAIAFAAEAHKGQVRKGTKTPYIIHPMEAAAIAATMTDNHSVIAAAILHDVLEDTKASVLNLPVSDEVKRAVECLTLTYDDDKSKYECKKEYYEKIKTNKYAILVKGLDRKDNLKSMTEMGEKSVMRNLYETQYFLLPILGDAKEIWPEYNGQLHTLRTDIRAIIKTLAHDRDIVLPHEQPSDTEMREIFS